ncbi:MAG TPA: acetate uptake transporter [Candidatus Dormibacteraeota bacterium]
MANNNPAAPQAVMHTAEAPPAIADPAPLGLAGFGFTTLMAMTIAAGIISNGATAAVLPMAAAFGGTAQFLAGMWAFRRGNTFAATAFSAFGAFWWSYYLLIDVFLKQITPASAVGPIVGLYFCAWFIFTAYMFIASLHGTRAVQSVFLLLTVTFAFLAISFWNWFGASVTLGHIAGYIGILTAIAALYTSFADVLNATARRVILPTN